MDAWWWVAVVVLVLLVALALVGRRAMRSRVDPTDVTIEPDVAVEVGRLYRSGQRAQAAALLRERTGLSLPDAARIAERLGRRQDGEG